MNRTDSNAVCVPWDEASFSGLENVLYDFVCPNLVIHADENRNPVALLVFKH
jgi:hypothetical protein